MKNKRILLAIVLIILVATIISFIYSPNEEQEFSVSPVFLKTNIPLGGEFINKIKITNNEAENQKFNL